MAFQVEQKKRKILYICCRLDPVISSQENGETLNDNLSVFSKKLNLNANTYIKSFEFLYHLAPQNLNYDSLGQIDGIVIGGSPVKLNEETPEWTTPLQDYLKNQISKNTPILGICFGHQLIGQMLGSKVIKKHVHREFGNQNVSLTKKGLKHPLFKNVPKHFRPWMSHNLIVDELPKDAQLLAHNAYCQIQAVEYKPYLYGVQFHPEFRDSIAKRLLNERAQQISEEGLSIKKIERRRIKEDHSGQIILKNFIKDIVPKAKRT